MEVQLTDNQVRSLAEDACSCWVREGAQNFKRLPLYEIEGQIMRSLSGLRQTLTDALRAAGYKVKLKRLINMNYSEHAHFDRLDEKDLVGRDDQIDVLGLIIDHPESFVVEAPTAWGKSFLIVQVCKMFPKLRIAIVAPGKDVVQMLYNNLKEHIYDIGQVGAGGNYINRITVCTTNSVYKLQGIKWDLLLFDEVHRAAGFKVSNELPEVFTTTKCVGFSASPEGRSDGADLVVEALFGPIVYRVSYKDAQDRGVVAPIKALMLNIERGPWVPTDEPVDINRYGLWRNDARNRLIAQVAESAGPDDQVLIMVQTAEHALFLKRELPDYEIIFTSASDNVIDEVLTGELKMLQDLEFKDREELRIAFEEGRLKKAIATGVWSTGVNFRRLRYLIRADGCGSRIMSIQTPGRLSRVIEGKTHGILIDFFDGWQTSLRRRSSERRREYRSKEWDLRIFNELDQLIACAQEDYDAVGAD